MSLAIEYFEIDLPYCALTYGVAPCTASVGVTGDAKCFNTLITCQDLPNIDLQTLTVRFAKPTSYLPRDIACLPWINSIDFTPAIVSLGENLGQRSVLKVTLSDNRHSDVGFDKYYAERGYDPYFRGSFWPRFRARYASLRGAVCRWRIGFVGDALADMETRYFFIESFDGPAADGTFSFTAKDALKFLDGDRAQIPRLSNGFLQAAITNSATAATLAPAGIGNAEYLASGFLRMAGREDVAFTRTADALTITRAQFGSIAVAHAAGDRVQQIQRYAAMTPADIVNNILLNYTDVPASRIPLTEWQEEVATYLGALYTFTFGEPTPVSNALSRIIQQAGLAMWDDDLGQKIRMKVIRAVPVTAETISESHVSGNTFDPEDQPEKRVSQAWVYYGMIDTTKRLEDPDNYRSTLKTPDDVTAAANEQIYGSPSIKKIFADGIAAGGSSSAGRVGAIVTGRYQSPPRRFKFSQTRNQAIVPLLGSGYNLDWISLQDSSGARELVPIEVVKVKPSPTNYQAEAEEMRFTSSGSIDPNNRVILINFDDLNLDLRAIHDGLYPSEFSGVTITFIISSHIGSNTTAQVAVDVGAWPGGVVPIVVITGRVQGAGGKGGGIAGQAGFPGGVALYTRSSIKLAVSNNLWSGGGGGGATNNFFGLYIGGGGGAGQLPGAAGATNSTDTPNPGTTETGGAATPNGGSAGGDPGLPGSTPAAGGAAGGAAGAAIDGVSFVTTGTYSGTTFTAGALSGNVRGSQIN